MLKIKKNNEGRVYSRPTCEVIGISSCTRYLAGSGISSDGIENESLREGGKYGTEWL